MTDSEILDWIEAHLSSIRTTLNGKYPYTICWLHDEKGRVYTDGINLRDCVRGAIAGDHYE